MTQLYEAESAEEVDAELAELDVAVSETRAHAGDEVADHVAEQQDALARAADGFVGSLTTDGAFESDVYQVELEIAVDDLANEADDFREQGPDVHEAFWQGVDGGLAVS